jgi:hypothetical protein
MRSLISAFALLAMMSGPVVAQTAQGQVTDEKKPALTNDPAVKASQDPQPTAEGNRAPQNLARPTESVASALVQFYKAPPALDGTPMPRPNPLAGNPESLQLK